MNTERLFRELHHPDAQTRVYGTDFAEGSRAFVPSAGRFDDRHRRHASGGESASDRGRRHNRNRRWRSRGIHCGIGYFTRGTRTCRTEFERNVRSVYKQMVRIEIEPRWARFFDFGTSRLPAFLNDLINDDQGAHR